ncbi:THUMP domain-containing protein [Flammeovirgaceae bacterium SG7u.111]|nr:THUMP domain-containing protein [Flammeovirgaceae bacterium SG7u.132]WPO37895.1 THUMP domain-containing protein [Flammeovirgaceae bacterium SG7u.111]
MEKFEMIAKTLFGFEELLAAELEEIGATDIELLKRAVKYRGDQEVLYKSNYLLRTAIKVLKPITTFQVRNEYQLYDQIKKIDWEDYMTVNQTLAIEGTTSGEIFTHSKYVALKSKDAVVDQFRDKYDKRPSVDTEDPDLRINVHIAEDQCTVSLDSSGVTLNKRGYRLRQVFAPMSEVLASGILMLTGWDKKRNLINPMCGSGTVAIEATLMARNVPAGYFRDFAFQYWKDFDQALWKKIKDEAIEKITDMEGKIYASDIELNAIKVSIDNAERAGVDEFIEFEKEDFLESKAKLEDALVIINPPYGERLEEAEDMVEFYKEIGTQLKHGYNGCDAWILSGNLDAIKFVGLRPSRKIKLFNGPIDCKLHKFELYRGSKKASKQGKV